MDYNNNESSESNNMNSENNSNNVDNTPENGAPFDQPREDSYNNNQFSSGQTYDSQQTFNNQPPYNNQQSFNDQNNYQNNYYGENQYNNQQGFNNPQNFNNQYNDQFNGQYNNGQFNNGQFNNGQMNNGYYDDRKPSNGFAIASLILGILSILFSCCYGFGIFFSIPGIILAIVSRKSSNGKLSGMAIGGLVCSILGTLIAVFMIAAVIKLFSSEDFMTLVRELESSNYTGY